MINFLQNFKRKRKGKKLLMILLILISLFILSYALVFIENYLELESLRKHPVFYSLTDELYGGEILVTYNDGKHTITEFLTNDGKPKTHLEISPDRKKLGYFLDLNYFIDKEKNREIDFIDYDNYTALIIMNIDATGGKEIYKGNYHTSYWEWLNNDEVAVYYNCGTECLIGYVIDVNTGAKKADLFYGVGYQWSSSKELVVAYHFSGGYGITVGNKYGNVLFEFRRQLPIVYSKLTSKTEAIWSIDNKILTLIIKKENEEELETIKFDVNNDFQIVL